MKQLIINGTANQYAGLRLCSSARGILHLTDVVQLSVGGCAGCRRRGGGFGERTLQYCVVARLSTFASKTPAVAGVLLVGLHYTAFRDAIREDSRQTTPSRGVTQRKKFAVEANVESRASKDSFCGQGDHCD